MNMDFVQRLERFMKALGLSKKQLAEILGVEPLMVSLWCSGTNEPGMDIKATLTRLEGENIPALSPQLSKDTVEAFRRGRLRAQL
jgi:transcriptional regulator with XRE-family HTH domain